MYSKILLFLLGLHTSTSRVPQPLAKIKLSKNLIVPELRTECQKIVCPETEESICVKVKISLHAKKSFYIIMTPCELEYKYCHPELVARVVSMRHCTPEDEEESNNRETKGPRRFKRDANKVKQDNTKQNLIDKKSESGVSYSSSEHSKPRDDVGLNENSEIYSDSETDSKVTNHYVIIASNSSNADANLQVVDNPKHIPTGLVEFGTERIIILNTNVSSFESNTLPNETSEGDDESQESPILPDKEEVQERNSKSSEETEVGNDKEDQEIIFDKAPCPTECPVRDVMVCARCKHGIFRTFYSICHMRMFSCENRDDDIELIARYPCIMSAPVPFYEKTKGRASEVNDYDLVLNYIKCRQTGKLDSHVKPQWLSQGGSNVDRSKYIGNCDFTKSDNSKLPPSGSRPPNPKPKSALYSKMAANKLS